MTAKDEHINFEKKQLKDIQKWIDKEILVIKKNDKELKKKIDYLKRESKGKYNEELDTSQKLYKIIRKNLKKYEEAKQQPYFGRIDFKEYKRDREIFYIGKFGLGDSITGDEKVIDWRSPIADLYYSGILGQVYYKSPMGIVDGELSLKRKFIIKHGNLQDIFDEGINEIILRSDEEGIALIDEFLKINLEKSVSSKLRDIVATIQKEQNDIIRSNKNKPLIVQGSAGSGKTTVALHRLAYLLYKYKNNLSSKDILVLGPNRIFLDYISEILPDLGINNIKQETFENTAFKILKLKGKIYGKDKKLAKILEKKDEQEIKYIEYSSKVKGNLDFKNIMDKYILYLEKKDISNIDHIKVGTYILFDKKEIERLFTKDLIKLPLNKRKEEIKRYLNLKLGDKIQRIIHKIDFYYEYKITRTKNIIKDEYERRKKLIEIYDERDKKKKEIKKQGSKVFENYFKNWNYIDHRKLYMNFFNNKELFYEVMNDKVPHDITQYMIKEINENFEKGIIDNDDLAPMLYLKFKIEGISSKDKFKHIVIDESQDYSIFEFLVIKEMVENNSFTLVGDIGQSIYYYRGIKTWDEFINKVFEKNSNYVQLTQSYRSTVEIINLANKILLKQNNNFKPALSVLRHGNNPKIIRFNNNRQFAQTLDKIVELCIKEGKNNIAVIGKTYDECKKIRVYLKKYSEYTWNIINNSNNNLDFEKIIIPSYMTKGLEFDCSVIYNCNVENYKDLEIDKKILYVVLTRALHLEYIFYKDKISPLLKKQ